MVYAAERAQLLTIPVYIVAAIRYLTAAFLADRLRRRYSFTMIGVILTTVSYVLLLCQQKIPTGADRVG